MSRTVTYSVCVDAESSRLLELIARVEKRTRKAQLAVILADYVRRNQKKYPECSTLIGNNRQSFPAED